MNRFARIALNFLLPPGIAAFLIVGSASLFASEFPDWRLSVTVLMFAYIFASIPSAVHTLIMERFYRRGMSPDRGRAIAVSSISGFASGTFIVIFLTVGSDDHNVHLFWYYPALGAVTGCVTALLVRHLGRESHSA